MRHFVPLLLLLSIAFAPAARAAPADVEPPRLIEGSDAPWPAEADAAADEVAVVLIVTLDATGTPTEVSVAEPAGAPFDQLARDAVLRFRFEPARRGGVPMPARIRYTHVFQRPPPAPVPTAVPAEEVAPQEADLVVTVQGETAAQRRRRSAEAVQVIEIGEARHQTADLGEVLARQEGIAVRRSGGLGSSARISLGGLGEERIRFFLDGIPLDLAGFPFGLANLPVNLVERVEVYRGVVPVRYGADALGGAIDLITTRPEGTGASASVQGGSFGLWRATAAGHHHDRQSGLLARLFLFADVAENDYPVDVVEADAFGGESDITTPRNNDDYQALGGGLEVGFLDRGWADRVLVRVHGSDIGKGIPHNLVMTVPYGAVRWGRSAAGSQLVYEKALSSELRLDLTLGYAYQETDFLDSSPCSHDWGGDCARELQTRGEVVRDNPRDQTIWQHGQVGRLLLSWSPAADHTLRFSTAPTRTTRTGRNRLEDGRDPLADDRSILTWISGAEWEVDLFDDRLETIVFVKDYRYDASAAEKIARGDSIERARAITATGYGVATRLLLRRGLRAKASWELATRLPRVDEVFGDGVLVRENLKLHPETSHNLNLGLEAEELATGIGTFRGRANGFLRLAEDLIFLQLDAIGGRFENVNDARSLGVEVAAGWTAPGGWLHLDGNLTWQDFRNTSSTGSFQTQEGDRMPNEPWLLANIGARLEAREVFAAGDEFSPFWRLRYVHDFFRNWESLGDRETKQIIDPQLVQSAGITWHHSHGDARFGLTAEVDNLTDAKTFDFFGIQRAGRAFYGKATLEY